MKPAWLIDKRDVTCTNIFLRCQIAQNVFAVIWIWLSKIQGEEINPLVGIKYVLEAMTVVVFREDTNDFVSRPASRTVIHT